jgi:tRNA(Ile)-lysidine synthase
MSHPLTTTLQNWLSTLPPQPTLVVAYSGGRDSHVLLHALKTLRDSRNTFSLKAIHINHGLQKPAEEWVLHCQSVCEQYAIPITTIRLDATLPKGESVEAWAREARYHAFVNNLLKDEILVTAHHACDQAETFLLQLLRGAGPMGLASMPQVKSLGQGRHIRPLLNIPAQIINAYAQSNMLTWVDDPTNAQTRYTRNALRHKVVPELEAINPQWSDCISRAAKHCADNQRLLEDCLQETLARSLGEDKSLDLVLLQQYSILKQNALLRMWLGLHQIEMPSTKQLEVIRSQFCYAKEDAKPSIPLKEGVLKRFKNRLYCVKNSLESSNSVAWPLRDCLKLNDGSHFQALAQKGEGIAIALLSKGEVEVRFRSGGERCQVSNKPHRRPLKKILQDFAIAPWQRQQIPLFYYEDTLIAVGALFICEGWQVKTSEEMGWVIKKVN